jgi:hypothetical protein
MGLSREIIDLVGLCLLDDSDQIGGVGQIPVVKDESWLGNVRIFVEMLDPPGVEARGSALDAVNDIPLLKQ